MTNAWFINSGMGTVWGPYDFSAWTVTTLTFFYMVFPVLLPFLQTLTTGQLITMTVWFHHIQVENYYRTIAPKIHIILEGLANVLVPEHVW